MPFEMFWAGVGASVLANMLTVVFLYAMWRATKEEQAGRPVERLPFWVLMCGVAPPLFAAWCISLVVI